MRVLIVEDDYLQADWLRQILTDQYQSIETERIRSENEFRRRLEDLRRQPPDLILLDVMLRWSDPGSSEPTPEDVGSGGFYRAGLRCERLLRENEATRSVPVILYTVLDQSDLDDGNLSIKTRFIPKSSNPAQLLEAIRSLRKSDAKAG